MVCRLASKCESYEETMLVLSEWQTYGNSRDAQLSDVNQEVQKLRGEIAVLRNQADGDRREISSLRQQVPHLTGFERLRMPDIDCRSLVGYLKHMLVSRLRRQLWSFSIWFT